nr:UBN2 domain-containing protein [Tanacetum cinerariifolium]
MHNDIMAASFKERLPMLAPEKQKLIDVEAKAAHMILNRIGNDIYSTVDACLNAKEMWIAIERLQQGKSINIQDVKTKLFWEFGKFTSRDGASIESYYTRFYGMMNEMVRNNLKVDTMQECRPTKRVKDYEYHKEKMLLCKKVTKGIQLDNDYNVFAIERQHPEQPESINETYVMEKVDSNVTLDSSYMITNEQGVNQNAEEPENERVLLASLIANLKLNFHENKKIQKQLKKANTSLT